MFLKAPSSQTFSIRRVHTENRVCPIQEYNFSTSQFDFHSSSFINACKSIKLNTNKSIICKDFSCLFTICPCFTLIIFLILTFKSHFNINNLTSIIVWWYLCLDYSFLFSLFKYFMDLLSMLTSLPLTQQPILIMALFLFPWSMTLCSQHIVINDTISFFRAQS